MAAKKKKLSAFEKQCLIFVGGVLLGELIGIWIFFLTV